MMGTDSELVGALGVGMKVKSADGTVLGKITELLADGGFRVEKGVFFRHAHVVARDEIGMIEGDVVFLRRAVEGMTVPVRGSYWNDMSRPGEEGSTSVASHVASGRGDADADAYDFTASGLGDHRPAFPAGLIDTGDGRFSQPQFSSAAETDRVRIAEPDDTLVDVDGRERFFKPTEDGSALVDTDGDGRFARPEDAGKVDGWRVAEPALVDTDGDGRFARPEDAGKVDAWRVAPPMIAEPVVAPPPVVTPPVLVDTDGDGRFATPEDAGKIDGWSADADLVDSDGDGRFARREDAGKVDGPALAASAGAHSDRPAIVATRDEGELVDTDGDGRFATPEDAGKVDGLKAKTEDDLPRAFFARSDDEPTRH